MVKWVLALWFWDRYGSLPINQHGSRICARIGLLLSSWPHLDTRLLQDPPWEAQLNLPHPPIPQARLPHRLKLPGPVLRIVSRPHHPQGRNSTAPHVRRHVACPLPRSVLLHSHPWIGPWVGRKKAARKEPLRTLRWRAKGPLQGHRGSATMRTLF